MMTDEEARKTWCPFTRLIVMGTGSSSHACNRVENRDGSLLVPTGAMCLGSQCQLWRLHVDPPLLLSASDHEHPPEWVHEQGFSFTGNVRGGDSEAGMRLYEYRLSASRHRGECGMKAAPVIEQG